MSKRDPWTQERVDELRDALKELDKPRSSRPIKQSQCKQHRFITTDRCFDCGAPEEAKRA